MFKIVTPRLTLRELDLEDAGNLLGIFSDPEAMRYYPATKSLEETRVWIRSNKERYQRYGFGIWGAYAREDDRFLGQCGLLVQDVDQKTELEIGYMFLRQFWGQGFATEAASACRDYAFQRLGSKRVISLIDPANVKSIRVAQKVGMQWEKEVHKWDKLIHVYALKKDEDR
jgi:RimJ/RimL family protein N-acetyltransferase